MVVETRVIDGMTAVSSRLVWVGGIPAFSMTLKTGGFTVLPTLQSFTMAVFTVPWSSFRGECVSDSLNRIVMGAK